MEARGKLTASVYISFQWRCKGRRGAIRGDEGRRGRAIRFTAVIIRYRKTVNIPRTRKVGSDDLSPGVGRLSALTSENNFRARRFFTGSRCGGAGYNEKNRKKKRGRGKKKGHCVKFDDNTRFIVFLFI